MNPLVLLGLAIAACAVYTQSATISPPALEAMFQARNEHLHSRKGRQTSNARRSPHAGAHPQPRFHASSAPLPFWNVLDYGAAGDNSTDNTEPFQNALLAAQSAGGGTVFAPAGLYLFLGSIYVPTSVTLQGSYTVVPSHDLWVGETLDDGTVLLPTANRGNASASPFITIYEDAVMRGLLLDSYGPTALAMPSVLGLVIFYPEQESVQLPVPYPWTVYLTGDNAAMTDVELLNPYNAICAVEAHRHYIARIQGQPINIGVFIDETYDIGRLEDIHWNPWFSCAVPFIEWQTSYGRAFVMGRSDWEYVFNTFAFGYAIGYHFIETSTGSMNGNFLGLGADLAVNASVHVDASQAPGLLITNGEFTAFHSSGFDPTSTSNPNQVYVSSSNSGPVHFVDCSFWGPTDAIANLYGTGTTIFDSCTFVQWDLVYNNGTAAINAYAGNLILQGNEFQQSGNHVNIGSGVSKGAIVGNVFTGVQTIANKGKNVQIGLNADDL